MTEVICAHPAEDKRKEAMRHVDRACVIFVEKLNAIEEIYGVKINGIKSRVNNFNKNFKGTSEGRHE